MARIVRWEGLRDEREMRSLEMSTCLCVLVLACVYSWGPWLSAVALLKGRSSALSHRTLAFCSRECLPGPSPSGYFLISEAAGGFSRGHLIVQGMHPFNPFRELVK